MTLKAVELDGVCKEIAPLLVGKQVQKVIQPDRATVILAFPRRWLVLSADARLGRVHLVDKPAGTGEAAPAFCMLLRKELTGARLVSLAAVAGERACELELRRGDETRRLRLFLYGRSGQLVLVGDEERALSAIGPARAPHGALPPPRPPSGESRFGESPGLSDRVAAHYREAADHSTDETARIEAEKVARAALEKHRRREKALLGDRAKAEAAVVKRKLGDLLFAHLGDVPRGASSVTLPDDFEGGAPIVIPLDPARSPTQNAERMYKEHKRLGRAMASIDARLAEARRAIAREEAVLAGGSFPPAPAVAPQRNTRAKTARSLPYRQYKSASGAAILVGRGAERNDELTFKVARGSDLWMHARDVPGAHVVVPLSPGRAVDEQTLLDAATLAAHHSSARDEPQVDIGYTLRKHVRKPAKSRPGSVLTSELKTLRVRVEQDRLARLLASRTDEER